MRWLVDTSAWGRRSIPEVREQLESILAEQPDSVLALSPPVLLELLRGPQYDDVGRLYSDLTGAMEVIPADATTWEIAAAAMQRLATHAAEAHRGPGVADLVTAALAHQHGLGVIHVDGHFELLSAHAGLSFPERRLSVSADTASTSNPAATQRALRKRLLQQLHRMPIADAETFLRAAVESAEAANRAGSVERDSHLGPV